jgi:hypothetical protein
LANGRGKPPRLQNPYNSMACIKYGHQTNVLKQISFSNVNKARLNNVADFSRSGRRRGETDFLCTSRPTGADRGIKCGETSNISII